MDFLPKNFADKLTDIALKQYQTAFEFKQGRLTDIRKNVDFYLGRKIKVPKGRFGVPLPTMAGFVDSLEAKIDDAPTFKFSYGEDIGDYKIAKKISALWQKDQSPQRANWPLKDRWEKKLAIFSGVGASKIFSESDPKYKSYNEVMDYEDLMTEPMGGGDLEQHLFNGQDNIFRLKEQLKRGAIAGLYDVQQVKQLITRMSDTNFQKSADLYQAKSERMSRLGLNLSGNTYVGQEVFKLIEWYMDYEGERYYLLFEWFTKTWVRAHKLTDMFSSGLWPITAWHTHEDAFNFWSKAPCDDMRPVADAIDVLFNQALDNRYKRNFGQRAYDPQVFKHPEQLIWKPDGLVVGNASVKSLSKGVYEFKTEEINGTIDMIQFIDMFGGKKSGLPAEGQQAENSSSQKVGIYYGNLQQMADRLGLLNKSYREAGIGKVLRYAWGLVDNLTQPEAVKIIGEKGVEWTELTKGEAKKAPDLDIDIIGGSAEMQANQSKMQKRTEMLALIAKVPKLQEGLNPKWFLEETLRQGEYDESEIKAATNPDSASLEMMSDASNAVQEILKGKKPKIRRNADTSFIKYIMDFALDNDIDIHIFNALKDYAEAHLDIAASNAVRKAAIINSMKPQVPAEQQPIQNQPRTMQPQPAGAGTGVGGNQATEMLKGNMQ